MKIADQYHRFVRWSDEDQLYIGYCPDLYFGGVCHGESEEQIYAELCGTIRDEGRRLISVLTKASQDLKPQPTMEFDFDFRRLLLLALLLGGFLPFSEVSRHLKCQRMDSIPLLRCARRGAIAWSCSSLALSAPP